MARAKDPVTKVLPLVGNLIERLRARLVAGTEPAGSPEYMFSSSWGTLTLVGGEATLYRKCRDALIDLHGKNNERRVVSRRTVERALTDTLLRALRISKGGFNDARPVFERRAKSELRNLRKVLSAPLRRWRAAVEVTGLGDGVLPLDFGRVTYVRGNEANAAAIASAAVDVIPGTGRMPMKPKFAKHATPEKDRKEIVDMFSDNAIAMLDVEAMDVAAARDIAVSEVRRNVDIINFFAPMFEHPVGPHVAHVGPANRGVDLKYAVFDPDTWAKTFASEPPNEWSLRNLRIVSAHSRRVGLDRVHDLLARPKLSDLEKRILTAIMWAGRARAERRHEQAFLLYAIALESLVTKPNARAGITERLKMRVAYIIHRKAENRRILVSTMERLYDIRSALVHTGTSAELSDGDLKLIEWIAEHAIVHMLVRPPFRKMKDAAQFERWFEDRMLGA